VDATTFVVARLTGQVVVDHFSAGFHHPMYDPSKREWNEKLRDEIVETERLPELAWTHEIAGEVTEWAASESGLIAGTPFSVGTIDAGAKALSVGVTKPGEIMLMYGSTIFIIQVTDNGQARDERLWVAPTRSPAGGVCSSA
jgi:xylulokinase